MKKEEFEKIKNDFNLEEKRWKSLKKGQKVYESVPRFFDMEYFEIIIQEVNVKERFIIGKDMSQQGKIVKLYGFDTVEELKEIGIEFVNN